MKAHEIVDFVVVGAGIAGASVAYRLAPHGSVLLLERESQPGYHSTGRSAAMFMESYGTPQIQALTRASRPFYLQPPSGFTEHPILTDRGCMYVATLDQKVLLEQAFHTAMRNYPNVELIDAERALSLAPCLRPDTLLGAVFEPQAKDIDAHALLQGYLKGLRTAGGTIQTQAELRSCTRLNGLWHLELGDGLKVACHTLINAAGAWADEVARLCKVPPIGLQPRRRSAFTFAAPAGVPFDRWPCVASVDERFYFKPDAGQLMGSPANADPVPPHDVLPQELDVAIAIDHIERATTLTIRRPTHTWAGLRSFVSDGDLVVGWDNHCDGFFWLAAQGGYGIQSSAGVSELACALLLRHEIPQSLRGHGVEPALIAPDRLR